MKHNEFMNLKLENISEEEIVPGFIDMWLDIKGCRYGLRIMLTDNGYIVRSICHYDREKPCQLCGGKPHAKCTSLELYKEDLLHRLVRSRELRLFWVNREYKWD